MSVCDTQEPCGVLVVNKPEGPTSHDIINVVRKIYGTKRVGHTGTLDPMATGVLVVLIGRAAKAAEYISAGKKSYRALLRLGMTTDTQDTTGKVLTEYQGALPKSDDVINVSSSFVGKSMQMPPMYSALKVDGKKLVDLARKGIEIERESRPIEIFSILCKPESERDYLLDIFCSGGTYIRTLCHDIGQKLACGGVMASLCRTETCGFSLSESHTPDELKSMTKEELYSLLIPTESLFSSLPSVNLSPFYEKLCRSGCEIYQKKIHTAFEPAQRVRICSQNGEFFALGEVSLFDGESAVKAIKIFRLE